MKLKNNKNSLDREIKKQLECIFGFENVSFEEHDCYIYSIDCSNIEDVDSIALAVVFPENKKQIQELVRLADKYDIKLTPRGSGTNHVGGCVPLEGGIVVSFSRMDKIIEINTKDLTARLMPGVVIEEFQRELDKYNLFFPPDPANMKVSTIVGAVSESSGGPRCFKYGTTKDYVLDLCVVLANGEIINTGKSCVKNVAGYNLTQLFVGSEGTLGLICEITVRLIPKPECSNTMLVYFDDIAQASNTVEKMVFHHIQPSAIELLDQNTLKTIERFRPCGFLTDYKACLLIEVDGFESTLKYQTSIIRRVCIGLKAKYIEVAEDSAHRDRIWLSRRSAYACCTKLDINVVAEDVVVPISKISELVNCIDRICRRVGLKVCIMGHIGDGNIHPNFALDLSKKGDLESLRIARKEILELAVALGGSITGEHGIGFEKKDFLAQLNTESFNEVTRKIKESFDPKNILNPGKICDIE